MAFNVFWCARDLAGVPLGNHHFILIYSDPIYGLPPLNVLKEKGVMFTTLGAFDVGGNLTFRSNEPSDVKAVREELNTKKRGWFSDLDLEQNEVSSSLFSSQQQFAENLVKQATKFKENTLTSQVKYTLANKNCSAWVNTMFKISGVSSSKRKSSGEFSGFDWGEEDLINEKLFK